MERLPYLLVAIGFFFLIVNVQLLWQLLRFRRIRASALLTWPGRTPPFYRLFLAAGAILALVIVCKLAVLHRPPTEVFGESMMLVYYSYAQPLSLKIGRGFYQDGIWAEGGFVPYSEIGGLTWREGEQVTLVMMFRWRNFAKSLIVPQPYYGAARRPTTRSAWSRAASGCWWGRRGRTRRGAGGVSTHGSGVRACPGGFDDLSL